MNEETMNEVEVTEVNPIGTGDEPFSAPEESSEGGNGLAKFIGGMAVVGAVATGVAVITGVKKLTGWVKNKAAKKKVVPDEDGCVAESEAGEVTEEETEETQEENVQKKNRKR